MPDEPGDLHDPERSPDPDDAAPDDAAPDDRAPRRLLAAFAPQGAVQIAVAIIAVCFLAGAVGYTLGTRSSSFPTSDVDVGFLIDMSDHHDQAVAMALCTTNRATEAVTRDFAKETLVFQNHDLGMMKIWLDERATARPTDDNRQAMRWMGMSTLPSTMPGMASAAQLDELCRATGRDADRLFLTLMREHHRGGVHMADYAAAHAVTPEIRDFASVMAKNQSVEANEYTATLKRLGFE